MDRVPDGSGQEPGGRPVDILNDAFANLVNLAQIAAKLDAPPVPISIKQASNIGAAHQTVSLPVPETSIPE